MLELEDNGRINAAIVDQNGKTYLRVVELEDFYVAGDMILCPVCNCESNDCECPRPGDTRYLYRTLKGVKGTYARKR